MESNEKFKLKRTYKSLVRIGYSCLLFFALSFVALIIYVTNFNPVWDTFTRSMIVTPIIISGLVSAFLLMFSGQYLHELYQYRKNIQTYRSRKFANNVINYIQSGEIQLAIDEYRKCKWFPDKFLDDYLYGMVITACFQSNDAKLHQIGVDRIDKLQETFNYQKVIL